MIALLIPIILTVVAFIAESWIPLLPMIVLSALTMPLMFRPGMYDETLTNNQHYMENKLLEMLKPLSEQNGIEGVKRMNIGLLFLYSMWTWVPVLALSVLSSGIFAGLVVVVLLVATVYDIVKLSNALSRIISQIEDAQVQPLNE